MSGSRHRNEMAAKSLRDFQPRTPLGKRVKQAAERYVKTIKTDKDALRALTSIGIYNRDGTLNPYFYPDAHDRKNR